MNQEQEKLPTEVRNALEKCFAQIRLARSSELAKIKRFHEAEAVLIRNGELPDDPHELDLLARIAALQGRFDEARLRWNAAIQKEPENESYRECVEHLTSAKRICRLMINSQDTLLIIMAWVTIAFAIGALVYILFK